MEPAIYVFTETEENGPDINGLNMINSTIYSEDEPPVPQELD
jgi:hypothetical protein